MLFSIVTPNLNGLPYLKRCVASLRDQPRPGLDVEHFVVDGGSTDGSPDWLSRQPASLPGYSLSWMSEPDKGMYDAICKGWRMAGGALLAWLNSDEQYLPDTLTAVADCLKAHAEVDFVYGDTLLVHPDDTLIAFRKATPLRRMYLRSAHLYIHSSSLFVRRRLVVDADIWPDAAWRAVGDHEWILRLLEHGAHGYLLRRYLSAFVMTGANLGGSDRAAGELRRLRQREPFWIRCLAPLLCAGRTAEKLFSGGFRQAVPFAYQLSDADGRRILRTAPQVSWRWRSS